jgi:hypothetical protein
MERVGFEHLSVYSSAAHLEVNNLSNSLLRSWVQIIPPGPLFTVVQVRYCFELVFDSCRTKSLAKPMPYCVVCQYVLYFNYTSYI